MKLHIILLFLGLAHSYVYYNHYRLKYPNYIIKKTKFHKDLTKIDHNIARKSSNIWYDELKIKHIMKNNQNINLLYKSDNTYFHETTVEEYTDFMYNIEMNYNGSKYLLWKPCVKPLIIKDDNDNSSIFYPSFRESLSIICYDDDVEKNKVLINNFIVSPYIRSDKNTNINKEIKKVLINYFLGYLKFNKIEFKVKQ